MAVLTSTSGTQWRKGSRQHADEISGTLSQQVPEDLVMWTTAPVRSVSGATLESPVNPSRTSTCARGSAWRGLANTPPAPVTCIRASDLTVFRIWGASAHSAASDRFSGVLACDSQNPKMGVGGGGGGAAAAT